MPNRIHVTVLRYTVRLWAAPGVGSEWALAHRLA